jgi:hypothetical protein
MATSLSGFVRQEIPPQWRPAPARPAVPKDTADTGVATLSGSSPQLITLSSNASAGWSKSDGKKQEWRRRVDLFRVYQVEDDGTINNENFVDVEVPKEIDSYQNDGWREKLLLAEQEAADNIEKIRSDYEKQSQEPPRPPEQPPEEGGPKPPVYGPPT